MRESYLQLTSSLRKEMESKFSESKDQINTMVRVELMLTGFNMLSGSNNAREAWSVIPGYNYPVLPQGCDQGVSCRLRILFGFYRIESNWLKDLEQYKLIREEYRLFRIMEDGIFTPLDVRHIEWRKDVYTELLNNPIPRHKASRSFAKEGEFTYERWESGIKARYSGTLHFREEEIPVFPAYHPKKDFLLDFSVDWNGLASEMDQIEGGQKWSCISSNLKISSINNNQQLRYNGINHIAGGLGAGKSKFILMETFRLVKKHGAKVGLIEGTVAQMLQRIQELKSLGINAVPIIGYSSRAKHRNQYLWANINADSELSTWSSAEHNVLKHLSGKCFIHALASDYEADGRYPCKMLLQNNKQKLCPLVTQCGVYADTRALMDAEVWVASAYSVLKSRLPVMLDPYERTFYEAMYDLLDVIFVDEADQVQGQFETAFLHEYDLLGQSTHLLESLEREVVEKSVGRYQDFAGNSLIVNFRNHLASLTRVVWEIYHLLDRSARLRNNLHHKKLFHIYALAHELARKLSDDDASNQKRWKGLKSYIGNPVGSNVFSSTADKLLNPEVQETKHQIVKGCLNNISQKFRKNIDQELLLLQLEFFIYLGRLEYYLDRVMVILDVVAQELNVSTQLAPFFSMRRDFSPFLKEGMTGMLKGYRYKRDNQHELGTFKFFEYIGIGRLLLKEWHNVYAAADNKSGPAIVLLSGTSYAPGSRHYHLDEQVNWLLESDKVSPKITQYFRPVIDSQTAKRIAISGISDMEERGRRLESMVEHIKPLIEYELSFYRDNGRRVLLVVNSYDDLERVADSFLHDGAWSKRFKVLSRDKRHDSHYYPLARIEQFKQESADVLVVPLLAMNRGYNILDEWGGALFGSVFFLIRPYPVPDDLNYIIQALHAQLPIILQKIEKQNKKWGTAIKALRRDSILRLEHMVRKPDFWAILNKEERKALSWFILIPVWQMIGRLVRGGREARVFYVDDKFGSSTFKSPSLLEHWQQMLVQNKYNIVLKTLYHPFMSSLPDLSKSESE